MDFFERQRRLKGFGDSSQRKLEEASVLIAGVGGLGCPVALYLAAAGVGEMILVDGDRVSASNLHRQVLFGVSDIGAFKAESAATKLSSMYPDTHVIFSNTWIRHDNLTEWINDADIIVDATDNFSARYLLNDCGRIFNKPVVHGSVLGFEGQLTVFHYPDRAQGFDLRHFMPVPPTPNEVPACNEEGVLGVLPGVIGTLMAAEAIKVLTGAGTVLSGVVKHFDLRTQQWYDVNFKRSDNVALTMNWKEVEVVHADSRPCANENVNGFAEAILIDVREPGEIMEDDPVQGINIPLGELKSRQEEWKDLPAICFFCHSGTRSKKAMSIVNELYPEIQVSHLEGGINYNEMIQGK